jgi:hypothetical protein
MKRFILAIGIAAVTFVATATPARASATYQGLTFTFTLTDSDTLTFGITGTPEPNWDTAGYLGAFALKFVGEDDPLDFSVTGGDTATANGPGAANLLGLNAQISGNNTDCAAATKGEEGVICFDVADPAITPFPMNFQYTIDFSDDLTGLDAVHLQIAFLEDSGDTKKVGSLYSQDVALSTTTTSTTTTVSGTSSELPEPTVLSLLGAALLGAGYRLRRRRA